MKIAVIRAVKRDHYPGYFTPQRFWPSSFKAVEVVDQDEDPTIPDPKAPHKQIPDPHRIGQQTLRQVQGEKAFLTCSLHFAESLADVKIDPDKGVVDITEAEAIRVAQEEAARIRVEADAEIARHKARIAALEAQLSGKVETDAARADETPMEKPAPDKKQRAR